MIDFYKDKRVFITGHTGFKGAWLSKILIMMGATVKGYSLAPDSDRALFTVSELEKNLDSVYADVRNLDKLSAEIKSFQPDIVFHMAAQPIVSISYLDPVYTYAVNVMGTVNILEACRALTGGRLKSVVNVTTDKVYENKEWCYGYREVDPLNGFDPYSNSKSCSDLITSSYQKSFFIRSGTALSSARSGNVIGGGDYSVDRIVVDCMLAAENQETVVLRNPHSIRPYQHVMECLKGYLMLAQAQYKNKAIEGAYNFGPDACDCVTTEYLVKTICKYYGGLQYEVKADERKFHEANFLRLDNSKAQNVLGWTPQIGIEQAAKLTVEFYKIFIETGKISDIFEGQIKSFFGL